MIPVDFSCNIFVVNKTVLIDIVEHEVEQLTAEVHAGTMRQMPSVIQAHSQDGIARLEHAQIRSHVRLRTAVRLNIHMIICLENLSPFLTAVFLQFIHMLTAAVVPTLSSAIICPKSGVTLTVFIREAGAHRPHYIFTHEIFAGNQLDILCLTCLFLFN